MKKLILSLVLLSSLLFGAQGDHKAEIMGTVGGVVPEGNLNMDDSLNLGLRFGTYVEDTFFDVLEAGFERASVDYDDNVNDTNINRFFVNLVKEYDITKDTALYALAGIGYENVRDSLYDNDDDGFVQYGVGIKQWITDDFALKAEVRHALTFESNNNLFYTLGFVIPIGKKVKEMPMPVEVKKVEPKPEPMMEPKAEPMKVVDNDTDKDGVINELDECPQTPVGTVVNTDGCVKLIRLHVNFDYDKADIKAVEMMKIEKVVDFMKANSSYKVVLDGHTDSRGSKKYNMALGEKRANAVSKVLVDKGIAVEKIMTNSFGEDAPIATNETTEGRAQNRRVDAHFMK